MNDLILDPPIALLLGAELVVFLVVLLRGLSRIREHLEKTESLLAHVQWGVRAIETQTAPLEARLQTMVTLTQEVARHAETLPSRLASSHDQPDVLPESAHRV
ncbi:MAG TPA: hypothetical protein VFX49_05600 [Chloroflexota bacterium]|nr:hypothetical protein [Chloroflexota bacterium]